MNAGVPPQSFSWNIKPAPDAQGRFPITITTPGADPLTVNAVLGNAAPPAPKEILGDPGSPLKSLKVSYTLTGNPHPFWPPLEHIKPRDAEKKWWWPADWLIVYLLAYLPIMFGLRWLLKIA